LRSHVNAVDVEVFVDEAGVRTAFPSWRQYHAATISQAYKEWFSQWGTLKDLVRDCARKEPLFRKLSFPASLRQAYLGKIPAGISAAEWDKLEPWLSPKRLSEATQRFDASALQLMIFEWLERSRIVQEFEGVEGPVR
jgi:hypothetical protein